MFFLRRYIAYIIRHIEDDSDGENSYRVYINDLWQYIVNNNRDGYKISSYLMFESTADLNPSFHGQKTDDYSEDEEEEIPDKKSCWHRLSDYELDDMYKYKLTLYRSPKQADAIYQLRYSFFDIMYSKCGHYCSDFKECRDYENDTGCAYLYDCATLIYVVTVITLKRSIRIVYLIGEHEDGNWVVSNYIKKYIGSRDNGYFSRRELCWPTVVYYNDVKMHSYISY